MVDKSRDYGAAARAMEVLAKFGDDKRNRTKIIKGLVRSLRPDMPGRPKPGRSNEATGEYIPGSPGSGGTSRWGELSSSMVVTLNDLTGRKIGTILAWFDTVQRFQGKLDALFVDPEEDDE